MLWLPCQVATPPHDWISTSEYIYGTSNSGTFSIYCFPLLEKHSQTVLIHSVGLLWTPVVSDCLRPWKHHADRELTARWKVCIFSCFNTIYIHHTLSCSANHLLCFNVQISKCNCQDWGRMWWSTENIQWKQREKPTLTNELGVQGI